MPHRIFGRLSSRRVAPTADATGFTATTHVSDIPRAPRRGKIRHRARLLTGCTFLATALALALPARAAEDASPVAVLKAPSAVATVLPPVLPSPIATELSPEAVAAAPSLLLAAMAPIPAAVELFVAAAVP